MSFWKHEPPKPTDDLRNLGPMRVSTPIECATYQHARAQGVGRHGPGLWLRGARSGGGAGAAGSGGSGGARAQRSAPR